MTQETPAKVCCLLGASLFSMFFLFAVAATNASFSGTEMALPDTFSPDRVIAALDSASAGYSQFLEANLIQPATKSYGELADNYNFVVGEIADQYGQKILAYTGLQALADRDGLTAQPVAPKVAGAFTSADESPYKSFDEEINIDSLYSMLIR